VSSLPPLEPLPPVALQRIELVSLSMQLSHPLRTAAGEFGSRMVLLVHVVAEEAEGWAECAVEPAPTYSAEYTAGAKSVLLEHLFPLAWLAPGDAFALAPRFNLIRGHQQAKAAVELALLDAQLRSADLSLAGWLGATAAAVPAGAALSGLAGGDELLADADAALAAGAARLRVKIAPGTGATSLGELRAHVGADVPLQADANGTFSLDDPDHLAELEQIDDLGLTCLEQPLAPDDLLGHARLAERLRTPICLDEPLTSLAAIEVAVELGACEVVCLKPARVGGWIEARRVHDRCAELGVPVWVGGMLETAIGRAGNLAVAALPGMALPPDLDPRGRFDPDLADPGRPIDGLVAVPTSPGIGVTPDYALLAAAEVARA
jgi:O-succinylbenzoate synthase